MPDLKNIVAHLNAMSIDDLRMLNSAVCDQIRNRQKFEAAMATRSFAIGDVIKFDGKTRGMIHLEVTGFSRDRTKIKGVQLNKGWTTRAGSQWNVFATAARASTRDEALKA